MEGKVYEIGPEMAIFGPAEVPHRIEVDEKNSSLCGCLCNLWSRKKVEGKAEGGLQILTKERRGL
jgi:hypothetical protein